MVTRACIDCGCLIEDASRCAAHQAPIEAARQRTQTYRKGYRDKRYKAVTVRAIWMRDGGVCQLCFTGCPLEDATKDHITPLSQGGSGEANNLRLAHKICNSSRGGKQ